MNKTYYTGLEILKMAEEGKLKDDTKISISNNSSRMVVYGRNFVWESTKEKVWVCNFIEGSRFTIEEEPEEIDIQAIEEFIVPDNITEAIVNEVNIAKIFEKLNESIKAVKQLDRKINSN